MLSAIVVAVFSIVMHALAQPYGNCHTREPCRSSNLLAVWADLALIFFFGCLLVLKAKVDLAADTCAIQKCPTQPQSRPFCVT